MGVFTGELVNVPVNW